jgi:hypothetical protein
MYVDTNTTVFTNLISNTMPFDTTRVLVIFSILPSDTPMRCQGKLAQWELYGTETMETSLTNNRDNGVQHNPLSAYFCISFQPTPSQRQPASACCQQLQGGSNMTGTCAACLHTNQSRLYLNHLVFSLQIITPQKVYRED